MARANPSHRIRLATGLLTLMAGLTGCGTMASVPVQPAPVAAADTVSAHTPTHELIASAATKDIVRRHAESILGPRGLADFRMVIYINKQATGPMAQRAFLFTKTASGGLAHLDTWLVTTAREQPGISPKGITKYLTTPTGIYQFEPRMFVRLHKSHAWEADMPWAMFLKSRTGGPTQGYALHAALNKSIHNLGQRASAGCIRLLPTHAERLYKLLQRDYVGPVPSTSSTASLELTVGTRKQRGIQALVIIDDAVNDSLIARYGTGVQEAALR